MRLPLSQSNRDHAGESGFALVLVIWGLGLISLIAITVMTAERFRILATANLIVSARAEALAEAGVNLVRVELISAMGGGSASGFRFATNGAPLVCAMPGGALAALAVEDEGGKADLNTASPKLMSALLRGFGAGLDESDRLAAAIAEFSRTSRNAVLDDVVFAAYATEGRAYGPKKAPFESVLELDQVIGMRPDLLRAILPYVTVYSRKPGVDPRVAAPALLAALAGDEPARVARLEGGEGGADIAVLPPELLSPSTSRSFLVRAEIRMPAGGSFVQEAIIELAAGEPPDVVREWRRGGTRFAARLDAAARRPGGENGWQPC
ncbi:general secretion pathway protein K [Bradyrhizobium sp. AZCC 1678]|uniref:general secretion pathway protein GspK n=1 Tax=Bradyrhizobium sp. AZCC 1678 TaxID=3117030 RepID=UPI002FEE8AA1